MTDPLPIGLCSVHHQQAAEWRSNDYDWRNPAEWPAGLSFPKRTLLMDSRTSHEERARGFIEKNRQQIELIAGICKSGRSPQCSSAVSSQEEKKEGETDA